MENAQTNTNTENNTTFDYEAEYKKVLAERDTLKTEVDKQKNLKDQYAKENADYKRKLDTQMTDEEKKAQEFQAAVQRAEKAESELAEFRLKSDGLSNGFSVEETEKLISGKFSFKDIAEIMKSRVEEAVKSANAQSTKNSAGTLLGKGSAAEENTKSDFQRRQDERQRTTNIVEI
jgi:hypothetical protein